LNKPLKCNKIRFFAWHNALHCKKIDIDVFCVDGILGGKTGL